MQSSSAEEHCFQEKKCCVVEINTCLYGSTGKIVRQIADAARSKGIEVWTATAYDRRNLIKRTTWDITIGGFFSLYSHLMISRITGISGIGSFCATHKFIRKLNSISPDIIHIHNLHNSYINIPVLFKYIKRKNIQTVMTMHDCWAITGRCPYFDIVKCERWKQNCGNCVYPSKEYPISYLDQTATMHSLKRKWFSILGKITIVTPSRWLAKIVNESFLCDNDIRVVNNGIDLSVFKPTVSDFCERYHIERDKYIILGVAFDWGKRKGLDVFIALANQLPLEKYQIVLVGPDETVEKQLPPGIISIRRTQNQKELAEIYSAATLFLNPTREDNYPTVNMESIACGTPVLTFNTGGSPESVCSTTGCVIESQDIETLKTRVMRICEGAMFSSEACVCASERFDMNRCFSNYIEIYKNLSHFGNQ